jgi:DNA transformation protein
MATLNSEFAHYCCDLLNSVGPCRAKRMFGGWGISTDGLTVAILVDLGAGETLYLKASDTTRPQFEAAGCTRFTYEAKGVSRGINYYSAPPDAMESPALMAPWARMALQAAVASKAPPPKKARPKPAKPPRSR